jgi:hypothetical protein
MKLYAALIGRIRQEQGDLDRLVSRMESLMTKAKTTADDGYLDGVALNLHGFYTGVERIFEDIARRLDGELPSGRDWHKRLLTQMAAEIPDVRPPVIGSATKDCLENYRAFRHIVRNVYTFHLQFSRIAELADGVRDCHERVAADMGAFERFLAALG